MCECMSAYVRLYVNVCYCVCDQRNCGRETGDCIKERERD